MSKCPVWDLPLVVVLVMLDHHHHRRHSPGGTWRFEPDDDRSQIDIVHIII